MALPTAAAHAQQLPVKQNQAVNNCPAEPSSRRRSRRAKVFGGDQPADSSNNPPQPVKPRDSSSNGLSHPCKQVSKMNTRRSVAAERAHAEVPGGGGNSAVGDAPGSSRLSHNTGKDIADRAQLVSTPSDTEIHEPKEVGCASNDVGPSAEPKAHGSAQIVLCSQVLTHY